MEAIAALHAKFQQVSIELESVQERVHLAEESIRAQRATSLVTHNEIKEKRIKIEATSIQLQNVNEQISILEAKNAELIKRRDSLLSKQDIYPKLISELVGDFVENSNALTRKVEARIKRCIDEGFWIDSAETLYRETCRRQSFRHKMREQHAKNQLEEESLLMGRLREEEANTQFLKSCSDMLQMKIEEIKANIAHPTAQRQPAGSAPSKASKRTRSDDEPAYSISNKSSAAGVCIAPRINFRRDQQSNVLATCDKSDTSTTRAVLHETPVYNYVEDFNEEPAVSASSVEILEISSSHTTSQSLPAARQKIASNDDRRVVHDTTISTANSQQQMQFQSQSQSSTPWYQMHRKRLHNEMDLSGKNIVAALLEKGIEILNDFASDHEDTTSELYGD